MEDVEDVGGEETQDGAADGGGLSTGAKAGIGVGAAVGGLAVIALGVWMFLGKKGKKDEPEVESGKPEMDGMGVEGLGGSAVGEKEVAVVGEKDVSELPNVESHGRSELGEREIEVGELPASKLGDTMGKSELAAGGLEQKDAFELP